MMQGVAEAAFIFLLVFASWVFLLPLILSLLFFRSLQSRHEADKDGLDLDQKVSGYRKVFKMIWRVYFVVTILAFIKNYIDLQKFGYIQFVGFFGLALTFIEISILIGLVLLAAQFGFNLIFGRRKVRNT